MVLPVHDIPGRLRFIFPILRGNHRRAAALRARMRGVEGVTSASANPRTGSLIVKYIRAEATRDRIVASLVDFEPGIAPPETARAAQAPAMADRLADAIVERIVEGILRAAVAAVI